MEVVKVFYKVLNKDKILYSPGLQITQGYLGPIPCNSLFFIFN